MLSLKNSDEQPLQVDGPPTPVKRHPHSCNFPYKLTIIETGATANVSLKHIYFIFSDVTSMDCRLSRVPCIVIQGTRDVCRPLKKALEYFQLKCTKFCEPIHTRHLNKLDVSEWLFGSIKILKSSDERPGCGTPFAPSGWIFGALSTLCVYVTFILFSKL